MQDDPTDKAQPPSNVAAASSMSDDREITETKPLPADAMSPLKSPSWNLAGSRYEVSGEIARGGMGVVLRVIDTQIERPLAVKMMLSDEKIDASLQLLNDL